MPHNDLARHDSVFSYLWNRSVHNLPNSFHPLSKNFLCQHFQREIILQQKIHTLVKTDMQCIKKDSKSCINVFINSSDQYLYERIKHFKDLLLQQNRVFGFIWHETDQSLIHNRQNDGHRIIKDFSFIWSLVSEQNIKVLLTDAPHNYYVLFVIIKWLTVSYQMVRALVTVNQITGFFHDY